MPPGKYHCAPRNDLSATGEKFAFVGEQEGVGSVSEERERQIRYEQSPWLGQKRGASTYRRHWEEVGIHDSVRVLGRRSAETDLAWAFEGIREGRAWDDDV